MIPSLFNRQAEPGFARLWDDTLIAIAAANHDIFAVRTDDNERVPLFDRLADQFCRRIEPLIERQWLAELENTELVQLRDWLLPPLMNGQVRVA